MAASLRVARTSEGVSIGASQDPSSQNVQIALPSRLKGRNFAPEEECQLCKSVLHVS
jgi:hypothetical protein